MTASAEENVRPGTAGGGGWFEYGGERITFGFSVDKDDPSANSLVLQGRNRDMTVHPLEITKVWFKPCKNGGYPSVHMKGTALVNGTDVYRFHFKATDKGAGMFDACWMKLWPVHHDGGDENDTGDDATHDDDCSCSEDSESGDGIDSCDGGEQSSCQGGGCSGGGGSGEGGSGGGCSGDEGGCSGGGEGGHGKMIKWVTHSLGGGNIWVVMPEGGSCDCGEEH